MRRALVLTDEAARHPFRASLPPGTLARANEIEPRVPWRLRLAQGLGLSERDVQQVLFTWLAGFVATFTFFF